MRDNDILRVDDILSNRDNDVLMDDNILDVLRVDNIFWDEYILRDDVLRDDGILRYDVILWDDYVFEGCCIFKE